MADQNKDGQTYTFSSYPSPNQEFFPVASNVKCSQILASYNANVPAVYKTSRKDAFYARNAAKRSKVHKIKQLTQRPDRSVPPNALNTWKDLTPDVKLPDIRGRTQGEIYYTRGKLGEKLNRTKPEFDLSDPINKRKVLDTETYSALHDPHCKGYFLRPSVMKHLKKQRLINEKNEVLCDVHEFNRFRSYLGELFNDQVKRRINDNNAMEDMERSLTKALCAKQRKKQFDAFKMAQLRHQETNRAYAEATRKRHMVKIQMWKQRLEQIDAYRAQLKLAHSGMYTIKHWNAFLTRQKAADAEEHRKQHTLIRIAYAQTKNDYVTKYDKFVRLALFERYKADQAAVMVARDDQIADMEELVEETLKRARASWLKKYDSFIQHCRENPLSHYQSLLKSQYRKKFLMKKYFYKWIQFVMGRREIRPNAEHQSIFQVDKKLKPLVRTLKEVSDMDQGKCGAGDYECEANKFKTTGIPNILTKTKPSSKQKLDESTGVVGGFSGTSDKVQEKRTQKRKKKKQKQKEEEDGNEADIEEPDDFIDKMVARMKLDQENLKKKLEGISPSTMSVPGNRYPKQLSNVKGLLDDFQEEQKETISFLQDINRAITPQERVKGWRAMKY